MMVWKIPTFGGGWGFGGACVFGGGVPGLRLELACVVGGGCPCP